jgi:hypothetical protein
MTAVLWLRLNGRHVVERGFLESAFLKAIVPNKDALEPLDTNCSCVLVSGVGNVVDDWGCQPTWLVRVQQRWNSHALAGGFG